MGDASPHLGWADALHSTAQSLMKPTLCLDPRRRGAIPSYAAAKPRPRSTAVRTPQQRRDRRFSRGEGGLPAKARPSRRPGLADGRVHHARGAWHRRRVRSRRGVRRTAQGLDGGANNETTPASDATTPRQLTWCPASASLRAAHALRTPSEWLGHGGAAARRLPRRCGRAPGRRHRGVGRRHKRPVRGPFSAVSTANWTRPGCRDTSGGPFQRSLGSPLPSGHFQGPLAPVHPRANIRHIMSASSGFPFQA